MKRALLEKSEEGGWGNDCCRGGYGSEMRRRLEAWMTKRKKMLDEMFGRGGRQ
jgi:hypothetical protein